MSLIADTTASDVSQRKCYRLQWNWGLSVPMRGVLISERVTYRLQWS